MFSVVKSKMFVACALSAIAMFPASVSAKEIALTFTQHDLSIVGEFAGYEDNQYVVETATGTVFVPAAMVTCEGDDCVEVMASN